MISSNKSGFSLLETILAMLLIATMATPLVITQGATLRRVIRDGRHMERIFLMRNFLQEARREAQDTTTFNKAAEKSNTQLRYQRTPSQANSALHALKGIVVERVTAIWHEFGKETQDTLVTMHYIEPEQPKAAS